MKNDVLRDATRALREDVDESPARPDETRARVMRTLSAQRARRVATVRTCVLLAAVLVGSAAWAAATQRLPDAFYEVAADLGLGSREASEPAPAKPSAPLTGGPRAAKDPAPAPASVELRAAESDAPAPTTPEPSRPAPSAAPAPPVIAAVPVITAPSGVAAPNAVAAPPLTAPKPTPPPAAEPEGSPAPHEEASGPATPSAPVKDPASAAQAPVDNDAHALYQAAHRTHFVEHNPGAALTAWNAYLAAAPRGRFSVEAHYNRALCLVRLGRTDEARRALELFASGAFGGYRQTEARTLLDAMGEAKR